MTQTNSSTSVLKSVAVIAAATASAVFLYRVGRTFYRRRTRVERVYKKIDEVNAQDPRDPPQELEYGQRMTAMLEKYDAKAPDEVKIACRAQHIARWRIARKEFPEGKAGYLKWRKTLYAMHAGLVKEIMQGTGDFTEVEMDRTASLVAKQWDLKTDTGANAVEDCAALVFLQHYFPAFNEKLNEESKMVDIVRKTWVKMSAKGKEEALKLSLAPEQLEIVKKALASGLPAVPAEDD